MKTKRAPLGMKKKKRAPLRDVEPNFAIPAPTTEQERTVLAAVKSTFRWNWTRKLNHQARQQGIYAAYNNALALTQGLTDKRDIQKIANRVAGEERSLLLKDASLVHPEDTDAPYDDYKGDEPNEPLKEWDQAKATRPFVARGHYFDVQDEDGHRVGEDQQVGGTTGLQQDWKALTTDFKVTLQRSVEDINAGIDQHLRNSDALVLKCAQALALFDLTVADLDFYHHYYETSPHPPDERKRFSRLTYPIGGFWALYGYWSWRLSTDRAAKAMSQNSVPTIL